MKKILALMLAAMMLLASASVLAEQSPPNPPPPKPPVIPPVVEDTTGEAPLIIVELGEAGLEAKKALENAEVPLSEETAVKIGEVVGEAMSADEMFGLILGVWSEEDGTVVFPVEFATEYKVGDPVVGVLVTVKNGEATEYVLDSVVTQDYVISFTFPVEEMIAIREADEAYVIVFAAAAAE